MQYEIEDVLDVTMSGTIMATTRRYASQLSMARTTTLPSLINSRTGRLTDWTTHGLDISRTGQLADATGDFACLVFVLLAASARPRVVQSAI